MELHSIKNPAVLSALSVSLVLGAVDFANASGCSDSEIQQINTTRTKMYQALMYGQLNRVSQLTQQLSSALSPACVQALQAMSAGGYGNYGGYGLYGGYPTSPPSVYNHGGGTFSVPGMGACGPSGCIDYGGVVPHTALPGKPTTPPPAP